jgi:integrase
VPRSAAPPKATYRTRTDGSPGRWYAVWHEGGRKRLRALNARTRREADVEIAERFRPDETGARAPDRISCDEAVAAYVEGRGAELKAIDRAGYAIAALSGFWSGKALAEVNERSCQAYVRWRTSQDGRGNGHKTRRRVSRSTARRELIVLRAAIKYCGKHGLVSPVPDVWVPARSEPKDVWLTRDEAAALLRAARSNYHTRPYLPLFLLVALYTGSRKEVVLSLRWSRNDQSGWVDLTNGVIYRGAAGRAESNKRKPPVPIAKPLMTFLRLARRRNTEFVIERAGRRILDVKKGVKAAAEAAGLPSEVTPHVLRHTAGTWIAQNTGDLRLVALFLGCSFRVAEDTYAHHCPEYLRGAAAALSRKGRA